MFFQVSRNPTRFGAFCLGGGEFTKGGSGEMPEPVSRVSEKTLTNLISEFQRKKFS